jgi:hypothetical protein
MNNYIKNTKSRKKENNEDSFIGDSIKYLKENLKKKSKPRNFESTTKAKFIHYSGHDHTLLIFYFIFKFKNKFKKLKIFLALDYFNH